MAGLGSEGAREDEEDTAESLRLEGTKNQYKLCGVQLTYQATPMDC